MSLIPTDAEGFTQSFDLDQKEEASSFFQTHGFVIFNNILSEQERDLLETDIWSVVENRAKGSLNKRDPDTWSQLDWKEIYGSSYNEKRGFLGSDVSMSKTAFEIRQSPRVYEAFHGVLKKGELLASLDRYGLMRPTKSRGPSGEEIDHPEWRTVDRWLHWDQNPWTEPEFRGVQGLLAVSAHTIESGGFHCVPDFAPTFKEWGVKNEEIRSYSRLVDVPTDDPLRFNCQKMTIRPRGLLIWDSRTPHGNFPNNGFDWRMVFYLTFNMVDEFNQMYSNDMKKDLDSINFSPSELGRKVLGLDPWKQPASWWCTIQ